MKKLIVSMMLLFSLGCASTSSTKPAVFVGSEEEIKSVKEICKKEIVLLEQTTYATYGIKTIIYPGDITFISSSLVIVSIDINYQFGPSSDNKKIKGWIIFKKSEGVWKYANYIFGE